MPDFGNSGSDWQNVLKHNISLNQLCNFTFLINFLHF